jgi:hypothetical protein
LIIQCRLHFTDPNVSPNELDSDFLFLLRHCASMVHSQDIGVIQALTTFMYHVAPVVYLDACAKAMIRILAFATQEELLPILVIIRSLVTKVPTSFSAKHFYLYDYESFAGILFKNEIY